MPAVEGPQGILRPCQAPDAADAGCIGKYGVARAARLERDAGAEKTRGTDPSGVLKRSLTGIRGSALHYCHHGGFGTVRLREPMALETAGDVTAVKPGDRARAMKVQLAF